MRDPRTPTGRLLEKSLRRDLSRLSSSLAFDEGGGASLLKVLVLADLIVALDLRRAIEIGVYRGRLLLPLSMVMAALGRGEAVGIDPYSASAAVQRDPHDVGFDLVAWAHNVDWEQLHSELLTAIDAWNLTKYCRLIRVTSEDAAGTFAPGSIDLLHIDGNHDEAAVARDVELYVPKVRPGGVVVLDDVSWPSVRKVFHDLRDSHELHVHVVDGGNVWVGENLPNDFAVFIVAR
jgi:hypothetical protein